jgi:hypothetical protein
LSKGRYGLGHDPEKWAPVFGKDHAPLKKRDELILLDQVLCVTALPAREIAGYLNPIGLLILTARADRPGLAQQQRQASSRWGRA